MGYVLRGCVLRKGLGRYVFRDSFLRKGLGGECFDRLCFEARIRPVRFSGLLLGIRFTGYILGRCVLG